MIFHIRSLFVLLALFLGLPFQIKANAPVAQSDPMADDETKLIAEIEALPRYKVINAEKEELESERTEIAKTAKEAQKAGKFKERQDNETKITELDRKIKLKEAELAQVSAGHRLKTAKRAFDEADESQKAKTRETIVKAQETYDLAAKDVQLRKEALAMIERYINPFETPSERFKKAKDAEKNRRDSIAKLMLGDKSIDATQIPKQADIPIITNFGAYAHAGIRLISPYKFVPGANEKRDNMGVVTREATPSELKPNDTDAIPFFELTYTTRWAWRDQRISESVNDRPPLGLIPNPLKKRRAFRDYFDFDGEVRLGFAGVESSENSAKIVGSGRFNADVTIGMHIYRNQYEGGAYTFNLEASAGAVTDSSSYNSGVHQFFGLAYISQIGSLGSVGDDLRRQVLVSARMGYSRLKVPGVDRSNMTAVDPIVDKDGIHVAPKFKKTGGLGLEVEFLYPVLKQSYLTVGGKVYDTNPSTWTAFLGITTDLQKIVGGLAD